MEVPSPRQDSDSSKLILKEVERIVNEQLDNFKNLTSRAGTVLSVLIGTITATLTIAGVVAHPPFWAILMPSLPLTAALVTTCLVFIGRDVGTGPAPESLTQLTDSSESEVRTVLIEFYRDLIVGTMGRKEPDIEKFVGNRDLLRHKARLFSISVVLLAVSVACLVAVALYLA